MVCTDQGGVVVSTKGVAAVGQVAELVDMEAVRSRTEAGDVAHDEHRAARQLGHRQST